MTTLGLGLSIVGSAMLVVAQGPGLFPGRPCAAGAVGSLHYAGDAGAD